MTIRRTLYCIVPAATTLALAAGGGCARVSSAIEAFNNPTEQVSPEDAPSLVSSKRACGRTLPPLALTTMPSIRETAGCGVCCRDENAMNDATSIKNAPCMLLAPAAAMPGLFGVRFVRSPPRRR